MTDKETDKMADSPVFAACREATKLLQDIRSESQEEEIFRLKAMLAEALVLAYKNGAGAR